MPGPAVHRIRSLEGIAEAQAPLCANDLLLTEAFTR
jgi:hypothetical protein